MVHLAARLTVLATLVSLALDVAAVPAPRKAGHSVASTKATSGSKKASAKHLPAKHSSASKSKGSSKHTGGKRQFDTQQVLSSHGRYARNVARHDEDKVIVNGDHEHIHISDHDHHRHHGHHGHHGWDHDKIVLNGDHEHVHIKDRSDSSVLVNDNHGESYVVSRSEHIPARGAMAIGKRTDDDAPSGTIDLMLRNDAGSPKKLGSLYMNTNKNPVELDASDRNSSTSYMVEDMSVEPSDDPNVKFVQLHFLVTDARKLAVVPWCATYNPTPDHPAPMTVIPCRNSSEPADPTQSQSFMYLIDSGSVSPMSVTTASNPEPEAGTAAAEEVDDMSASATNFKRAPATPQTQNVTLVFTPSGPETLTQEDFASSEEDDHGMASTVTKTVTVTASASSSGTPAVAAAADPTTTGSVARASGSSSASSSQITSSSSSASSSSASSASASSSASAAAAGFEPLDVQVFKAGESSSSVPSSTISAVSSTISASSSTVSASSSAINAEAVASEVANASASSSSSVATSSSTSVSQMAARAEMTAVDTAPYNWVFKVKRDE
ncbi:hypothetical protein CYLTODRAFT_424028 [Cylindrobasidium torrendii FP15055 ss-10]|uniref:Uncharacterized protein n=1 Tax=Cylindrobasidium torrendii FP15055 ss-10 TaxID=1314674 RepID=A0A0D7B5L7_9AGAR|nr:hypothetical protein CYLTODRAFT_424028 [Cylindrobasidium torrendii FP15055 ss-10]